MAFISLSTKDQSSVQVYSFGPYFLIGLWLSTLAQFGWSSSGSDPDPCRFKLFYASKFSELKLCQVSFRICAMEFKFTKARYKPNLIFVLLEIEFLSIPRCSRDLKPSRIWIDFKTRVIEFCIWLDYSETWFSAIITLEFSFRCEFQWMYGFLWA